ncbi:WD40 repeat-like protein [Leucogyrophana mollusca]|uniref:WD40 repeat-like protein n=1 Tax=Leucogyrophana mollusca TaxID=85980 RepID=A0ACB8AW38_9AGAM|nr:WD40 repeat-like protein [Leucogyrophana mollusca]
MSTSSNLIEPSGVHRTPLRPTKVFKGHTDWINSIAFFPDSRHIASASSDETVIIWDIESGRQVGKPFQHDYGGVRWIAISPDGRRIANGMEKGGIVQKTTAVASTMVHELKEGGVWRLAYSLDGRWIASTSPADKGMIRLWDADTGRLGKELMKCGDEVYSVAFSPDGSRIAAGLGGGSFQVINISTGKSIVGPIKGHLERVRSIRKTPG